MTRALVLNASFEPLCVVSTKRALLLVLDNKAELIRGTGMMFRSERASYDEPSVVRLVYYVKVPYHGRVALNRRAVFARDGQRCQYCNNAAESIDHVVPRSKGGTHTWDNVVAACRPCNSHKQDRMLHETHMTLCRQPRAPKGRLWMVVALGMTQPDWEPYLQDRHRLEPSLTG